MLPQISTIMLLRVTKGVLTMTRLLWGRASPMYIRCLNNYRCYGPIFRIYSYSAIYPKYSSKWFGPSLGDYGDDHNMCVFLYVYIYICICMDTNTYTCYTICLYIYIYTYALYQVPWTRMPSAPAPRSWSTTQASWSTTTRARRRSRPWWT